MSRQQERAPKRSGSRSRRRCDVTGPRPWGTGGAHLGTRPLQLGKHPAAYTFEHATSRAARQIYRARCPIMCAAFPLEYQPLGTACSQGSHLMRASAGAAGSWVLPIRRRAPARHHLCVYDVFAAVLRILGTRPNSSSPLRGPACRKFLGQGPCFAAVPQDFSALARWVDGPVRAPSKRACQQAKTTGGEGELAGRLSRPTHHFSDKKKDQKQ